MTEDKQPKVPITLTVNGKNFVGWLQSSVRRSIETLAGTFSVPVSLVPGTVPEIKRQDEITVQIGETRLITGYVLSADPFYSKDDCGMRVVGRDRSGDLAVCAAIHKGGQWRNATLERIVKDIVSPYSIGVRNDAKGDANEPLRDFKLEHGERCADAIARAARLRGVLVVPDSRGNLVITRAGAQRFKGAVVRGRNVIRAEGIGSDEDRHSEYLVYGQSNVISDFESARGQKARAKDDEIGRHLPLVINAEGNLSQKELQDLAHHTMRVRRGHAYGIKYVVEGWEVDGEPWPINQLVPVYDDIFGLDGKDWLICEANPTCDLQEGDVTELVLRPAEAYDTVRKGSKPSPKRAAGKRGASDKARMENKAT